MRALFALLLFLIAPFAAAEIGIGDSREKVLSEHGKPTSIGRRGEREIFIYPKGGRIELINGQVADVKGPLPAVMPPPPAAEPAVAPADPPPAPVQASSPSDNAAAVASIHPAAPAPAASTGPKQSLSAPVPQPQPTTPPPPSTNSHGFDYGAASKDLTEKIDKMDTAWGERPVHKVHNPLNSPPAFVVGLVLRFLFTLAALQFAFRIWEVDTLPGRRLLIAAIDAVFHAVFELLGPVTHGFTTMRSVENGIAGLVLIFTIHRFSINKNLQNAVLTAALVKVTVFLLYAFAGLFVLNLLFGSLPHLQ